MGCLGQPRRDGRDRGAAVVEFALVIPLLMALVLGIIDYGLWFNDSISVRKGLREAARKSGTFDYRGNGAGIFDDSLIVVGDLDFSGNPAALQSTYTQTNNVVITTPSMGLTQ